MADPISRQEVEHIAHLARIEMTPQEIEQYQHDLAAILTYMDKLKQLDTEGVEPTAHPLNIHTVLRDDEVRPSYEPHQALQNAPQRQGSFFAVPKVLDQEPSG